MAEEVGARIDPGSLRKLVQASRTWDKVARAEMRKGLRASASDAAAATQRAVLGPPPGGGSTARRGSRWWMTAKGVKKSRGLRAGLAQGVKVSIQSGRMSKSGTVTGEGVRVTTTASALPADQEAMVKAYMARQFRHPVFGKQQWVEQEGKNWFFDPLFKGREGYQRAIVAAIEAASKAIEND